MQVDPGSYIFCFGVLLALWAVSVAATFWLGWRLYSFLEEEDDG
jgi:hypothetical protein